MAAVFRRSWVVAALGVAAVLGTASSPAWAQYVGGYGYAPYYAPYYTPPYRPRVVYVPPPPYYAPPAYAEPYEALPPRLPARVRPRQVMKPRPVRPAKLVPRPVPAPSVTPLPALPSPFEAAGRDAGFVPAVLTPELPAPRPELPKAVQVPP